MTATLVLAIWPLVPVAHMTSSRISPTIYMRTLAYKIVHLDSLREVDTSARSASTPVLNVSMKKTFVLCVLHHGRNPMLILPRLHATMSVRKVHISMLTSDNVSDANRLVTHVNLPPNASAVIELTQKTLQSNSLTNT